MNDRQAKRLGRVNQQACTERGWSLAQTVHATGIDSSWLNRLERGFYTFPAPDRLAVLAEHLDIDPAAIHDASAITWRTRCRTPASTFAARRTCHPKRSTRSRRG
jgi:transcriptional regulator with XRE-family HTH domain